MEIRSMETRAAEGEPTPDGNDAKLIIQVDKETEILVYGYGCSMAQMVVRSMNNPDYDPTALVGQRVWDIIAPAIVWATPATIAHLVMDTINNQ